MQRGRIGRFASAVLLTTGAFSYGIASAPAARAASPASVLSISAGFGHTCAVTGPNNAAKCWGWNDAGELGSGSTTPSTTPVGVSGLSSKVAAISAGVHRTCALTTAGGLKCWGDKPGNGTSNSATPVSVSGLSSGVKAVSARGEFTCALTTAGGVKCWGNGARGQMGDGQLTTSYVPVSPTGLGSGVSAVSVGANHACALTTTGGVKCWGYNAYGQTGDPSQNELTATAEPVTVAGLPSDIVGVSVGGFHSCAIASTGGTFCWGQNQYGQLGDGTTTDSLTPVSGPSGVSSLTGGAYHTCAIIGGAAKCWGANNTGNLGNGTTTDSPVPVGVVGLGSGVAGITGGRGHTCVVTTAGKALCWGWNLFGQVGNGTTSVAQTTPVGVSGLSK